ncbi:D-alanyl-D-alanine carboxypeptidase/D-alanyl-D-alanine-endopeptidase [Nocardia farcinica]|nr:D-alanyl-D-alanine carboxypeptidase/D-alanyl-D-alanine-endopeptidase [Nocardia farcinica]
MTSENAEPTAEAADAAETKRTTAASKRVSGALVDPSTDAEEAETARLGTVEREPEEAETARLGTVEREEPGSGTEASASKRVAGNLEDAPEEAPAEQDGADSGSAAENDDAATAEQDDEDSTAESETADDAEAEAGEDASATGTDDQEQPAADADQEDRTGSAEESTTVEPAESEASAGREASDAGSSADEPEAEVSAPAGGAATGNSGRVTGTVDLDETAEQGPSDEPEEPAEQPDDAGSSGEESSSDEQDSASSAESTESGDGASADVDAGSTGSSEDSESSGADEPESSDEQAEASADDQSAADGGEAEQPAAEAAEASTKPEADEDQEVSWPSAEDSSSDDEPGDPDDGSSAVEAGSSEPVATDPVEQGTPDNAAAPVAPATTEQAASEESTGSAEVAPTEADQAVAEESTGAAPTEAEQAAAEESAGSAGAAPAATEQAASEDSAGSGEAAPGEADQAVEEDSTATAPAEPEQAVEDDSTGPVALPETAAEQEAEEDSTGPVTPPAAAEQPVAPAPTAVEQTQQFRPITDAPPVGGVERTQQISRVEAAELGRGDTAPEIPRVETGQQPVDATQQISKVPAETEVERTTRIELSDLADLRKPADQGPATQRIPVVPPVEPAERTQQFARPDFDGPRPASAADFAGLTAPAASPGDFAGLTAPHAKPSQGLTPPPTASPEDFAGLTGRAQPQRIDPPPPADFAGRAQPQQIPPTDQPPVAAPPKRSRKGLIAVAVVVVVLLGAGIGFGPQLVDAVMKAQIADPPPPVRLDPSIKPLAQDAPRPTRSGLDAALAGPLSNPALGTLAGLVTDARTGEVLWEQDSAHPLVPASTGKLLAMSAALLVLDHDQRLTTKVVRGSEPGSVVLVGGGDVTLSTLPPGEESVYPGAARFDDLVQQVRAATGGNVTSVQVDTSRYAGPDLAPGWLPGDVRAGMMAPMEPVMLNGGRDDPKVDYSPRTEQPAMQAAQRLAAGLGATQVSEGRAPQNAEVLGQVQSPTVQEMVDTAMLHSDNMLAEVLAHEVAVATGGEPSFAGSWKAVHDVLVKHGFDLSGTSMADGSGLSVDDKATPKLLAQLLSTATTPASPEGGLPPDSAKLRGLLSGLPVAGGSGSLQNRYGDNDGRGWVRAKTGTLDGVNSLAGTVVTEDGRLLVFALMSNGPSTPDEGRKALDAVTEALRTCGCR